MWAACKNSNSTSKPDVQLAMEQVVSQYMMKNNIPGAIVGVWVPGEKTWTHTQGTADLTTGRKIKPEDKIRIASITKTFTATVILQLVDEGALNLEDTLDKWVPEIPRGSEISYSEKITIRHLCNHTAGIYSFTENKEVHDILITDPLKKWTLEEVMKYTLELDIKGNKVPCYFEPGDTYENGNPKIHYSDTAYELLGMIIEQVTGNKIGDEIQNRILDKLELKNTSFPYGPEMTGNYSRGYVQKQEGGALEDFTETDPSAPWAGGAMISNLYDLKVWAKALAEGSLLSEATQQQRLTWVDWPQLPLEGMNGAYGLGITCMGRLVGHSGTILGYNSAMFHLPSRNATIVVLLNKGNPGAGDACAVNICYLLAKILFNWFPEHC